MSQAIETVVLRNACALLSDATHWTSGAWARDGDGERCGPLSRTARQWCAWGALHKCAYELVGEEEAARKIAEKISKKLVPAPGGLIFVNERCGYDVVRAIMRRGGPPAGAKPTWPLPDFRDRQGLHALLRCTHELDRLTGRDEGKAPSSRLLTAALWLLGRTNTVFPSQTSHAKPDVKVQVGLTDTRHLPQVVV